MAEETTVRLGHLAPKSRIVRSFCLHFGLSLLRRNESVERIATLSSGGRMLLHLHPGTIQYYFLGTMDSCPVEVPVEQLLRRALRKGDVFFDVGANVGFYTFLAATLCGKAGSVHAFEANPGLKADLVSSVSLNECPERIAINAVAVGQAHGGEIALYFPPDSSATGIPSTIRHEWLNMGPQLSVPLISIDGYMSDNKLTRLDVVKLDIEGGELSALKGMIKTITTTAPSLIVCELMGSSVSFHGESHQRSASAHDWSDIVEFMRGQGYEPWHIRPWDGKLDHVSTPDEIEEITAALNVANVCFARPDLRLTRPELYSSVQAGGRHL